jgi:hypothetical protein
MRCITLAAVLLAFALLAGCANLHPAYAPGAEPDARSAYVAGMFRPRLGQGFALVLRSDSGEEFRFGLAQDSVWPTDTAFETAAAPLPPGRYRITHWFSFAILAKDRIMSGAVPPEAPLAQPFELREGEVMHLGGYVFSETLGASWGQLQLSHRLQPAALGEEALRSHLALHHPKLAALPLRCLPCSWPSVAEGLSAPAGAPAGASATGAKPVPAH